jgi:hypothetical protein
MITHNHPLAPIQGRAIRPTICRSPRSAIRQKPANQMLTGPITHSNAIRSDGTELLEAIEALLRRFVWLPNENDYTIIALWIVYTHAYDLFNHAPRLALHSPVPGCGKSTLFRILVALVRSGKIWINPTEATVFRDMAATHPTILFDEMDKYLYKNKSIHAVLNSGHMQGATVPRTVGEGEEAHVVDFDVFGPVAFALKGMQLPADLAERSLQINMQKSLTQFEKLTPDVSPSLDALGKRIAGWAKQNRIAIERAAKMIALPEAIINRAGDNWVPLFTIADVVGGDWPQRVTAAAMDYEKKNASLDKGILLLSNLKTLMENAPKSFYSSRELWSALNDREDWAWGDYAYGSGLNAHKLAKLLKGFGIMPRQEKLPKTEGGSKTKARGYHRRDFEKVWNVYDIQSEMSA